MTIPPFRTEFTENEIQTILQNTEQVLRSGQLTLGPHTEAFENALKTLAGTDHAVAVSSGCAALESLFRALQVRSRTVLVPANTNIATATAAVHAGAQVELYDAGLEPNLDDLAARLRPGIAAVVLVHIGGYITTQLDETVQRCADHAIPLVEDAAHAHGATHRGRPAGSLGHAAAFSFFPTKPLTTGEGGAVTTDDAHLAERVRQYRNHGAGSHGQAPVVGHSLRMPEISAVLGWTRLQHLAKDRARLHSIVDRYAQDLADQPLTFPDVAPDSQVSGYKSIALLRRGLDRETVRTAAAAQQVQLARGIYETPLHRHPAATEASLNITASFPHADDFAERHLCLPLWRGMTDAMVAQVINRLRTALRSIDHTQPATPEYGYDSHP